MMLLRWNLQRMGYVAVLSAALTFVITGPLYAADKFYQQHNLVSDGVATADHVDSNLVNAWGMVFNPNAFVWVANNGTGVSTLYEGSGNLQSLVVSIPAAGSNGGIGKPTGIVFNSSDDFKITKGNTSGQSLFIFAGEDGILAGWSPTIDFTHAVRTVDNSAAGAIYKGLALAANGSGHFLYATDFHNGKIDAFDSAFAPATLSGSFSDPNMPEGFAPFGIQNLNGDLYVTYAKQDASKEDDVAGKGLGFVDVFDANGNLLHRVASRGALNAPWGLALAPAGFGKFGNRLLVGKFGDGTIVAYDIANGDFHGHLRQPGCSLLKIDGL